TEIGMHGRQLGIDSTERFDLSLDGDCLLEQGDRGAVLPLLVQAHGEVLVAVGRIPVVLAESRLVDRKRLLIQRVGLGESTLRIEVDRECIDRIGAIAVERATGSPMDSDGFLEEPLSLGIPSLVAKVLPEGFIVRSGSQIRLAEKLAGNGERLLV